MGSAYFYFMWQDLGQLDWGWIIQFLDWSLYGGQTGVLLTRNQVQTVTWMLQFFTMWVSLETAWASSQCDNWVLSMNIPRRASWEARVPEAQAEAPRLLVIWHQKSQKVTLTTFFFFCESSHKISHLKGGVQFFSMDKVTKNLYSSLIYPKLSPSRFFIKNC